MRRAAAALAIAPADCGGGAGDDDAPAEGDGGGGDEPDAAALATPGCGVAAAPGAVMSTIDAGGATVLVYPQGLPVSATPSDTGWDLAVGGIDVALFDALHADLRARLCIDERRVFSIGHSFGGYFSNTLACARGGLGAGKVRAIASIAGGGPFGACAGDPVPALLIHGTGDMSVAYAQGTGSRDHWTAANQCAATTTERPGADPCVAYDGCSQAVWWCSHDDPAFSGHGWPAWSAAAAWSLFSSQP